MVVSYLSNVYAAYCSRPVRPKQYAGITTAQPAFMASSIVYSSPTANFFCVRLTATAHSCQILNGSSYVATYSSTRPFFRSEERRVGKSVDLGGRAVITHKK